ncbi:vacuolar ATPase assembly integral membrane protein VMA21 [Octopus bimaculoides]|uniref:Vacuolar ATPase assembly integral membrane protein VMA21 homolog n=1 Tax=Octopus bimaculoides TaxID=37653 RepID=A0A0L8GEB8_OCTBM|nr:vacuolar ATPase assembly integral membrane protein VMA21 [Octopus bimaculoides]|eukprot:XP_014782063.1 PREDICTED: vacuolar ATPase assembly integral membrane protein VMA21-like [Octopus bimaculoides]
MANTFPPDSGLQGIREDDDSSDSGTVVKTMMFFSTAMLTLPILSYFLSKWLIFENIFKMSNSDSYFYAAIGSIFTVHIILALFVYSAWKEGAKTVYTFKRD